MAIELIATHPEGLITMAGGDSFVLSAGSRLQVRHNEDGEMTNILNEKVPNGRSWKVNIRVKIYQTDI